VIGTERSGIDRVEGDANVGHLCTQGSQLTAYASANYLTAAILKLTGNKPASACTPAVKALETQLG
jgi:hypothetical protein